MTNGSTNCSGDKDSRYLVYNMTFSVVFVLGLFLNTVALYIFTCTLKQRNETTTYMLNLVVCDSLFVLSLPFRIFYFTSRNWPFGTALCKMTVMLFYTNMYGSVLFLTCICADRFLAIVHPFASRSLRTRRYAKMASTAVWLVVLSVSLSLVLQLPSGPTVDDKTTAYCFENYSSGQWKSELSKVVVVIETLGFVVPLLVNIYCSVRILNALQNSVALGDNGVIKAKILRMITVHLSIFCFCFIPYHVSLVLYTLVRRESITDCGAVTVVKWFYHVTLCIAVTNCCFNPVIYYFTSETIQNLLHRPRRNAAFAGVRRKLGTEHPLRTTLNCTDATM